MAHVVVKNLIKKYGDLQVVHGIDFEINDGEFVVLVGPSGCGKSTILRMIAGLETVTGGEVVIDNEVVNDVPPRERDVAMVFQDYALYPHMSVRQNLGFGLRMRGAKRSAIEAAVKRTAEILQIESLLERKPKALSGGQRQRVAIGRAIAREPRLFLFDEPLSNLDAKLRVDMRTQIKRLHLTFKTTSVYVTHDQVEAMTLADRIVILRSGVIEQIGTPSDLYGSPRNMFVAGFIGSPAMNFLKARLETNGDGLVGRARRRNEPEAAAAPRRTLRQACRRQGHARSSSGASHQRLDRAGSGRARAASAEGRDRRAARRRHA